METMVDNDELMEKFEKDKNNNYSEVCRVPSESDSTLTSHYNMAELSPVLVKIEQSPRNADNGRTCYTNNYDNISQVDHRLDYVIMRGKKHPRPESVQPKITHEDHRLEYVPKFKKHDAHDGMEHDEIQNLQVIGKQRRRHVRKEDQPHHVANGQPQNDVNHINHASAEPVRSGDLGLETLLNKVSLKRVKKEPFDVNEEKTCINDHLSYQLENAEQIGAHGCSTVFLQPYFELKQHSRFPEICVGGPTEQTEAKLILSIGRSGSGKTSTIYSMLNFLYGCQFEHKFRLAMELPGNFESTNDKIVTYMFTNTILPYKVVVVDTPGLDLTETSKLVSEWIKHRLDSDGKLLLDAIVPVVVADDSKLDLALINNLRKVLDLFGDDLRSNLLPITTFSSDMNVSTGLNLLKGLTLTTSHHFAINNLGYLPKTESKSRLSHLLLYKRTVVALEAFFEALDLDTTPLLLSKKLKTKNVRFYSS